MPTNSTTWSAIAQPSHEAGARADYARIDMESLVVPELVPTLAAPQEPVESPRPGRDDEAFWQRFGQALEWTSKPSTALARSAGDRRRRFAAAVHRRLAAEPADPQRTEERTAPVAG